MGTSRSNLNIPPDFSQPEYIHITPASAGWEHLSFSARKMTAGQSWEWDTGENELALVLLGGTCAVHSNRGSWPALGGRRSVFGGLPHTLFLPPQTRFTVQALSPDVDLAYGWCRAAQEFPARWVRPQDVAVEIRGGGNATRQINKMLPPGFPCSRLVVVEVYTPSGNWSSYPPHKHDEHRTAADGSLLEADLEEIYFYKFDRPEGFAYQRIYTPDRRLDEVMLVQDSHVVLSPEGYHPVVTAPGYPCYYLNMLAGSAQSLAASDDPDFTWVKDTWKEQDPRLPLVTLDMESA